MVNREDPIIEIVKKYIKELEINKIHISKAILFGSHALGKGKPESDIDVALISEVFSGDRFEDRRKFKIFGIDSGDFWYEVKMGISRDNFFYIVIDHGGRMKGVSCIKFRIFFKKHYGLGKILFGNRKNPIRNTHNFFCKLNSNLNLFYGLEMVKNLLKNFCIGNCRNISVIDFLKDVNTGRL